MATFNVISKLLLLWLSKVSLTVQHPKSEKSGNEIKICHWVRSIGTKFGAVSWHGNYKISCIWTRCEGTAAMYDTRTIQLCAAFWTKISIQLALTWAAWMANIFETELTLYDRDDGHNQFTAHHRPGIGLGWIFRCLSLFFLLLPFNLLDGFAWKRYLSQWRQFWQQVVDRKVSFSCDVAVQLSWPLAFVKLAWRWPNELFSWNDGDTLVGWHAKCQWIVYLEPVPSIGSIDGLCREKTGLESLPSWLIS